MADDKNKPKVGVYDDDATTATTEPTKTTTTERTATAETEKSGGIPSWVIALIVVAVIILALIFIF